MVRVHVYIYTSIDQYGPLIISNRPNIREADQGHQKSRPIKQPINSRPGLLLMIWMHELIDRDPDHHLMAQRDFLR